MLRRLKGQGITILVSTPYMDEASLCDRIALMQGGAFLDVDTPAGIVGKYDKALAGPARAEDVRSARRPAGYDKVKSCFAFGDSHHVSMDKGASSVEELKPLPRLPGPCEVEVESIRAQRGGLLHGPRRIGEGLR
jgi:ABC-2 type transport system ATP-binding protein